MEKETYKKAKEILEKFATVREVHHSRKHSLSILYVCVEMKTPHTCAVLV